MTREANVGGILGELFSLLGESARDFALYVLVIGGLAAVGVLAGLTDTAASTLNYGFAIDGSDTPASALFEMTSAVIGVVGSYLLMARLLAARGRLAGGGGRFWTYFGMAILSVIAIVLGLMLLVVPGILLLVRWSAASGFVIGAGESVTGSLSASWEATDGHGWAIFFSGLILIVAIFVGSAVVGAASGLAGAEIVGVVSAFLEAAASGVFAAFGIAIYCLVHDEAHEISEVFA